MTCIAGCQKDPVCLSVSIEKLALGLSVCTMWRCSNPGVLTPNVDVYALQGEKPLCCDNR